MTPRLTTLARQALQKAGLGFPAGAYTADSAQVMEQWLHATDIEPVHSAAYEFGIAADQVTRAQHRFFRMASVACLQMRTFLLAMEVTTIHEFEQLYRQMHVDMLSKAFRGTCVVKIVYGKRAR